MKFLVLLLITLLCCSVFVASESACFEMKTHHDPKFVIKLNDKDKIEKARDIISGKEKETTHVMGRIVKRAKEYNPRYSFHLDPDTITFFSYSIEVCDASLSYVEEHLDEACGAFLPGCFFCPWSSEITAEVKC